jgi:hypothetical protein
LFEQLCTLEDEYAVHYSRGATLYLNPTDGLGGSGDDVTPSMAGGGELQKLYSTGPYKCAADERKL